MSRFAQQTTTRIPLSDGDWIEVRDRLDFGRQQRLAAAGVGGLRGFAAGGDLAAASLELDLASFEIARILAWVTEWSFRDDDDRPVKLERSAVEHLDPDTADEIRAALDAHVERLEGEKKARTTTNGSGPTSR